MRQAFELGWINAYQFCKSRPVLTTVDDITSCYKCHKLLTNPKTLPCLHSYCVSCLEEKVTTSERQTVECLVCNKEFDLPANGIEGLQPLAIVHRLTKRKATQTRLMTGESIPCTACVGAIAHGEYRVVVNVSNVATRISK